jgi:hypothetical protein
MLTRGGVFCCAYDGAGDNVATAMAATLKHRLVVRVMRALLVSLVPWSSQRNGELRSGSRAGAANAAERFWLVHIHAQSIVRRNGIGVSSRTGAQAAALTATRWIAREGPRAAVHFFVRRHE